MRHSLLLFAVLCACRTHPTPEAGPAAAPSPAASAAPATAAGDATAAPGASEVENTEPAVTRAADEPAAPRDLAAMRAAGELRALVVESDPEALRAATAGTPDREAAQRLADTLGLRLRFITLAGRAELLPTLLAGKADLIADGLTVTGEAVASKPLRHTDLVLVTLEPKKGRAPTRLASLAGAKVGVLPMSGATAAVQTACGRKPALIVEGAGSDELDALLAKLHSAELDALVVEADLWQPYADEAGVRATPQGQPLDVHFAVAKGSNDLLAAVDNFVFELTLTSHQGNVAKGDLDEMKKRHVVRVAMLNNAASYFIYRGREMGFQYELARLFAGRLGVRLQIVVPDKPADLIDMVRHGLADIAPLATVAGSATDDLLTTTPFIFADQVLVQPKGATPITSVAELAGKTVYVRQSSAYLDGLKALQAQVPTLKIAWAPEDMETEHLIDEVAKGKLPLTVCNSILLAAELTWRDDVQGTLVLNRHAPLAYAVRADSPALRDRLDKFVERDAKGEVGRALQAKYFADPKRMKEVAAESATRSGRICEWDEFAKKYGQRYDVDWRLVLAQMYQESRFDPKAKSWVGAAGLLQLMPRTARELGVRNAWDPEQNIAGGVKYMAALIERFEPGIDTEQRVRFALASYNAGFEHVRDARRLSAKKGWNADRWFGNVEKAMVLLEKPQYFHKARFGYCRGREPVDYVSRIQSKYEAFVAAMSVTGAAQ